MDLDSEFFDPDDAFYTGPTATDALIADAQARLGYELPSAYIELLRIRNGGKPKNDASAPRFQLHGRQITSRFPRFEDSVGRGELIHPAACLRPRSSRNGAIRL